MSKRELIITDQPSTEGNLCDIERKLQTGCKNYDETEPRVAEIKVFHDADHQSFIEIPIVSQ
jgi:hypothetical protein